MDFDALERKFYSLNKDEEMRVLYLGREHLVNTVSRGWNSRKSGGPFITISPTETDECEMVVRLRDAENWAKLEEPLRVKAASPEPEHMTEEQALEEILDILNLDPEDIHPDEVYQNILYGLKASFDEDAGYDEDNNSEERGLHYNILEAIAGLVDGRGDYSFDELPNVIAKLIAKVDPPRPSAPGDIPDEVGRLYDRLEEAGITIEIERIGTVLIKWNVRCHGGKAFGTESAADASLLRALTAVHDAILGAGSAKEV